MAAALLHRVLYATALLLAVSMAGFALLRLMPGDAGEVLLIHQMAGELPGPEALARFKREHGLDDPLPLQYLRWLGAVLGGDLGRSFQTGDPVAQEVGMRLVNSVLLGAAAMALACAVAFPAGIAAALWRGGPVDRAVSALAVLGMAVPNFWYALLAVLLFSLTLGWLPSSGYGTWAHVVLPALVVGTSLSGVIARFVRSTCAEELPRAYVRTGRAKGVGEVPLMLRHVLPNTMVPVLALLGLQAARVFDGIVVVETVFAWPGLGRLLVDAILSRDFPVIQGCLLVLGVVYAGLHLAVDVAAMLVDPRIRGAV
ncbi:ABC transporter permease [Azospirillum halopraeferens]|uniref:ABC transporter permease n=1 Tax=Azospirillum halopraeferens TaxID=34010 RepID=UPI000409B5EA|nr:ABC transporter permease [Azospirillum halopraeferens]